MKKFFCVLLLLSLAVPLMADDREKDKDRLQSAATVLDDVMSAPDKGIPEEILSSAKCLAVVPSLLKGGFILSLNDHPEVRRIFARFRFEEVETTYTLAGGSGAKRVGELIISNVLPG